MTESYDLIKDNFKKSVIEINQKFKIQTLMFGEFYNKGQMVLKPEEGLGSVWISGYDFAHNINEL